MHGPIHEVYRRIRGNRIIEVCFKDNMDVGVSILRSSPHLRNITIDNNRATIELETDDNGVAELLRQLVQQQVAVQSYAEKEPTLEDVFMLVTKGIVA
jgi:ABC-2 type transport system ATP-binding protein